jgi:hypothetical protein
MTIDVSFLSRHFLQQLIASEVGSVGRAARHQKPRIKNVSGAICQVESTCWFGKTWTCYWTGSLLNELLL